jgi:RNA polymerase sigma-70 factor (ECF subfamily)
MISVFDEMRPQLFSLAYRMLGTRADAEDIVQEAFLRWQSADQEEVRNTRSYLNSIVARLSLDALKSARRKREAYVGTWLPEPIEAAPTPAAQAEFADSLSVAFLHVLESLSPAERVAFLMREIFGEDYKEVAGVLETSEANCRQLVTRARQQIQSKRPRFQVDPDHHRAVLREFLTACANEDKTALVGLLREDAVLYADGGGKRQAALNPIYGADRISRFFLGVRAKWPLALRAVPVTVGGTPSVLLYSGDEIDSLVNLDLDEEGRILGVYIIRNPDKLMPLSVS